MTIDEKLDDLLEAIGDVQKMTVELLALQLCIMANTSEDEEIRDATIGKFIDLVEMMKEMDMDTDIDVSKIRNMC